MKPLCAECGHREHWHLRGRCAMTITSCDPDNQTCRCDGYREKALPEPMLLAALRASLNQRGSR